MKFGSREICNVTFRAKAEQKIGTMTFKAGQPVLYIDTAKTSTLEGAATSVYATGGRGNTRLITWEGEKTLTFTVEDALLSPISFSMLSGAGLVKPTGETEKVHVHITSRAQISTGGKIDLKDALVTDKETICKDAPIFVIITEADGSITGETLEVDTAATDATSITAKAPSDEDIADYVGKVVLFDYYILRAGSTVSELQIDAENFAGYYYVEAETLFRRQNDGVDLPAVITIPNVKIQSNFTFSMAATGDPSTFTFTMDAMPGYTYFNQTKKVLCVIQIVEDATAGSTTQQSVMLHSDAETFDLDGDGTETNYYPDNDTASGG
jgi:hypothetical protein